MNGTTAIVNDQFHAKQQEALNFFFKELPKIMVLYGSVRSGKTYVLIALFLMMVASNANKKKMYLISGRNKASIWRNVILDMEKILGRTITLDRANCFEIFGNKILVLEGGMKGTNMKLRGNTLSGALLNETTTLYDEFIQETQNRLSDSSGNNGWMICDTNPDSLQSYIYRNYVKNDGAKLQSGRIAVKAIKFTIWDNPYMSADYVENLIKTTPDGHMFERMINGEWCNSQGMVWKDLKPAVHYLEDITDHYDNIDDFREDVEYYFASKDFGYEHYGVALLFAKTYSGKYYVIDSIIGRREQFEHYAEGIKRWYKKYGKFVVYCDWARPDGMDVLEDAGIEVERAHKQVLDGITNVCSMFKQDRLFILRKALDKIGEEQMERYEWSQSRDGNTKDEPKKENDDFPDALRYGVHSDIMSNVTTNTITAGGINWLG
ncbi:MAG: PBSX family phage terminase large subunit [Paraclostridium sp.]